MADKKVTVKRGDTLSSIAKENKTTVSAIKAANPKLTSDSKYKGGSIIFSGTKINIPKTNKPKVTPPKVQDTVVVESTTTVVEEFGSEVDSTPLSPSTISSEPSNISPVTQTPPPPPVKTAPIDTILFNEDAVPIQIMADLIFENIGGQELINIARNDTVNGQTVIYQPIKNLTSIQQEYNPNNIVALQATSDKYFQNFSIKLDNKVPSPGTGPNGAHVYIDPETGNLVVEAVNLDTDEQIELEITVSGTIYEADL